MNSACRVFLLLALVLLWFRAEASFNDLGGGTLLLDFKSGDGTRWVAPGVGADVDIQVTGPIVRATVTQTFSNPGVEWANATYVFPLPETAAVDHLRMVIGERIIEGQISEKQQAREIFDTAKREGKRASLVSQQRSNLFTTHVANIPPGGEIRVSIQYQHPVDKTGDTYSLRFPMTITPRYIPGSPVATESGGPGWSPDTDAVPDASHITPPWGMQGDNNHPTRIRVSLSPGFETASVTSRHHRVSRNVSGDREVEIVLHQQTHDANRDFILEWRPAVTAAPQVAAFTQQAAKERYSLLMVTPPAAEAAGPIPPREIVFVIDTSGSMGGEPLRQAKRALLWGLDRLRPVDSFNIIEFNSGSWALFGAARPAHPEEISRGKRFVGQLRSRGGTEMLGAMEKALCGACGGEKLRQVIFLTDGAIGNEEQLFRLIKTRLGNSRLFTVGIGGAPNAFFMRKAAETGRGDYTYVARLDEAGEAMARLFATLEAPMLTDIRMDPGSAGLEITPDPVPDVYAGKPLVVLFRGDLPGQLELTGQRGDRSWRLTLENSDFLPREGIDVLWGRQQIETLLDLYRFTYQQEEKDALKQRITALALSHHLVSPFTSLVAVDVTPAREAGQTARDHQIANNSPAGTHFGLTATATPATAKLLAGAMLTVVALLLIWWQIRTERNQALHQAAVIRTLRGEPG